jgi:hypothetical protein
VLDALGQALQDTSPTVREAAKEALEKLQGDDDDDEDEAKPNAKPATKKPQP